ncbi:MAG: SBBP repeat-containing protein [Nitrospirae bacterium]|nr:SBBP repeat-containing protein [Nitrospirota bacterium]
MSKNIISAIVLILTAFCLSMPAYANVSAEAATGENAAIAASYGKLPIAFEANEGQVDPKVKYIAKGQGYTLFLTPKEFVLSMAAHDGVKDKIKTAAIQIKFVSTGAKTITGVDELPGSSNYFIGNDPEKWRTNVPAYEKVRYEEIYHGIDLVVYGNQRQIEYDFVVGPHADYKQIAFQVNGAKRLSVDKDGSLIIASKGGSKMLMHKPLVYQETDGLRQEVRGRYSVSKGNRVSFNVAAYDKTKALVIDPTLAYSTYLGGSGSYGGDYGYRIAVDSSGSAYVTGVTGSTDFPTTSGAFQASLKSAYGNVFITKLNSSGTGLVYSAYLGGSGSTSYGDYGYGIAVDSSGSAYVTGVATSLNFPTTSGAFQTTLKNSHGNAFITKLNSSGTALLFSTYLGGTGYGDFGYGIAVDSSGSAYVTGVTGSTDFPTTSGAFQTSLKTSHGNVFITKLNSSGTALLFSTYVGGSGYGDSGYGIAVDSSGSAYVTGVTSSSDFPTTSGAFQASLKSSYGNAFITKINSSGTGLVFSTFIGGSGSSGGYGDSGHGVAVDSSGNAYVTGYSLSANFPTTTGAFQTTLKSSYGNAFIAKLNSSGTALLFSTYLGGGGNSGNGDTGSSIAIDSSGNAYVTGYTYSSDFPTTTGAFQTSLKSSYGNAFITKLNSSGTALMYSTYLGGSGDNSDSGDTGSSIAVDSYGNAYVAGFTYSSDFPTTTGAFQTSLNNLTSNAFITKLQFSSSTYSLSVSTSGSGTVISSPSGISCGSTCSASYTAGTSVTLTAGAASGYSLSSWSGCDSSSGTTCTVTMSSNKSVSAAFTSLGLSDSATTACAAINAIYGEYASWFGITSGNIYSLASGSSTYYVQWYTNGAALVAGTDGTLYTYYNGTWYNLGISWQRLGKATREITAIYNQYASWFGTTSGSIYIETSGSTTYYVQWFTNGAALVAGTNGYMYTYYNGQWYGLGVSWTTPTP